MSISFGSVQRVSCMVVSSSWNEWSVEQSGQIGDQINADRHEVEAGVGLPGKGEGCFGKAAVPGQGRLEIRGENSLIEVFPVIPAALAGDRSDAPEYIKILQLVMPDAKQAQVEERMGEETVRTCIDLAFD